MTPAHQLLARLVEWGDAPVNRELDCIISDARALLAAREESAWRPIETAPTGGSEVLVWGPDCGCQCAYFWLNDWLSGWGDEMDRLCLPTHWMPLPAAPRPQEK